jgi:hypothetical protein
LLVFQVKQKKATHIIFTTIQPKFLKGESKAYNQAASRVFLNKNQIHTANKRQQIVDKNRKRMLKWKMTQC